MQRYFLEVAYKGTRYSGFQVQANALTIQAEVEKALAILFKQPFNLTGSSRTDAGVHALQNYFHFDTNIIIEHRQLYNLNAILPFDIVIKGIYKVKTFEAKNDYKVKLLGSGSIFQEAMKAAEILSQAWRPWRSYAVLHIWNL